MQNQNTRRNQSFDRPDLAQQFGPPVYEYNARQAIADGFLVDLMQETTAHIVTQMGFTAPVVMTRAAYSATVENLERGEPLPEGQDCFSRIGEVLWQCSLAIQKRDGNSGRVTFTVEVWDGAKKNAVKLWSHMGPGEDGAPVITIMMEDED